MAIGGFMMNSQASVPSCIKMAQWMAQKLRHAPDQDIRIFTSGRFHAGLCEVPCSAVASRRAQLISDPLGTRAVVLAGEILNDIPERLRLLGSNNEGLDPMSDGAFILQLYSTVGPKGFGALEGSFAFAVYDESGAMPTMVLATDRLASWPIYYTFTDRGDFLFGTETDAVCVSGLRRQLNMSAAMEFFGLQRVYGDKTLLKGVRWLRPGNVATVQGDTITIRSYWQIRYRPEKGAFKDYAEELASKLQRSVDRRTKSVGSCGLLLSGGLDSRMLVAAAPQGVTCFTFGDYRNPEYEVATRIAAAAKCPHIFLERHANQYVDMIHHAVMIGSGMHPFNHAHSLGFVERIKEEFGCTTLFHGYGLERLFRGTSLPRLNASIGALSVPLGFRAIESLKDLRDTILRRGFHLLDRQPWRVFHRRFWALFREAIKDTAASITREALECDGTLEDAYLYPDTYYHARSVGYLFVTSMRPWVAEVCLVFDHDLIDLHLRIPVQYRRGNKLWLAAMRRLAPVIARIPDANTGCSPLWPGWMIWARKIALEYVQNVPVAWRFHRPLKASPAGLSPISWPRFDWMIAHNPAMRRLVDDVISDPKAVDPDLFDLRVIRRVIDDHMSGKSHNRYLIFLLLTFGIWHKNTFGSH